MDLKVGRSIVSVYPKLITSEAAKKKAALELVYKDLKYVNDCCLLLLGKDWTDRDIQARALFEFALIRYRRCFMSGVRKRVDVEGIFSSPTQKWAHGYVVDLASKHIAHSVNVFEQNGTILWVGVNDTGVVDYKSPGSLGRETFAGTKNFVILLQSLTRRVSRYVETEIEKASSIIHEEISRMDDQQILELPEGYRRN